MSWPGNPGLVVRSASAPADPSAFLTSHKEGWFRGDFLDKNGPDVSSWLDKFLISGNDIPQATEALQPVFSAAGGPNGTPMVQSDGTEYLQNTAWTPVSSLASTIYAVVRMDTWVSGDRFVCKSQNAGTTNAIIETATGAQRWGARGFGDVAFSADSADGNWRVVRLRRDHSNEIGARVAGGTETTAADAGGGGTVNRATLFAGQGGANIAACSLAEILFVGKLVSAAEDAAAGLYFQFRYKLGW